MAPVPIYLDGFSLPAGFPSLHASSLAALSSATAARRPRLVLRLPAAPPRRPSPLTALSAALVRPPSSASTGGEGGRTQRASAAPRAGGRPVRAPLPRRSAAAPPVAAPVSSPVQIPISTANGSLQNGEFLLGTLPYALKFPDDDSHTDSQKLSLSGGTVGAVDCSVILFLRNVL